VAVEVVKIAGGVADLRRNDARFEDRRIIPAFFNSMM
jgi:hypothetical protein